MQPLTLDIQVLATDPPMLVITDPASDVVVLRACLPPGIVVEGLQDPLRLSAQMSSPALTGLLGRTPFFARRTLADLAVSHEPPGPPAELPDAAMLEAAEDHRTRHGYDTASWRRDREHGWVLCLVRWDA